MIEDINSLKHNSIAKLVRGLKLQHQLQTRKKTEMARVIEKFLLKAKNNDDKACIYAVKDLIKYSENDDDLPDYETILSQTKLKIKRSKNLNDINLRDVVFKKSIFYKVVKLIYANGKNPLLAQAAGTSTKTLRFDLKFTNEEKKLLQNPENRICLFSTLLTDSKKDKYIDFPICKATINEVEYKINSRKKSKSSGVPCDLTSYLKFDSKNMISIRYTASTEDFVFYFFIIKMENLDIIIDKILKHDHIPIDKTLEMIKNTEHDEIATYKETVSLLCPCSYVRMEYPVRSIKCKHIQCFDLYSYLSLQRKGPTWTCPICYEKLKPSLLAVDDYFDSIIKTINPDYDYIEIRNDGSWCPQHHLDDTLGPSKLQNAEIKIIDPNIKVKLEEDENLINFDKGKLILVSEDSRGETIDKLLGNLNVESNNVDEFMPPPTPFGIKSPQKRLISKSESISASISASPSSISNLPATLNTKTTITTAPSTESTTNHEVIKKQTVSSSKPNKSSDIIEILSDDEGKTEEIKQLNDKNDSTNNTANVSNLILDKDKLNLKSTQNSKVIQNVIENNNLTQTGNRLDSFQRQITQATQGEAERLSQINTLLAKQNRLDNTFEILTEQIKQTEQILVAKKSELEEIERRLYNARKEETEIKSRKILHEQQEKEREGQAFNNRINRNNLLDGLNNKYGESKDYSEEKSGSIAKELNFINTTSLKFNEMYQNCVFSDLRTRELVLHEAHSLKKNNIVVPEMIMNQYSDSTKTILSAISFQFQKICELIQKITLREMNFSKTLDMYLRSQISKINRSSTFFNEFGMKLFFNDSNYRVYDALSKNLMKILENSDNLRYLERKHNLEEILLSVENDISTQLSNPSTFAFYKLTVIRISKNLSRSGLLFRFNELKDPIEIQKVKLLENRLKMFDAQAFKLDHLNVKSQSFGSDSSPPKQFDTDVDSGIVPPISSNIQNTRSPISLSSTNLQNLNMQTIAPGNNVSTTNSNLVTDNQTKQRESNLNQLSQYQLQQFLKNKISTQNVNQNVEMQVRESNNLQQFQQQQHIQHIQQQQQQYIQQQQHIQPQRIQQPVPPP
ncbi:hypothetical protein C6P42_003288, partial [Pichia californica]